MHFVAQHLPQRGLEQVGGGVQAGGLLTGVGQAALEALFRARVAGFLVLLEALVEVVLIHGQAFFSGQLLGHFDGEAIGVIELEGAAAVQGGQVAQTRVDRRFQPFQVALLRRFDDGHHVGGGAQLLGLGVSLGTGDGIGVGQDGIQQGAGILDIIVYLVKFLFALL